MNDPNQPPGFRPDFIDPYFNPGRTPMGPGRSLGGRMVVSPGGAPVEMPPSDNMAQYPRPNGTMVFDITDVNTVCLLESPGLRNWCWIRNAGPNVVFIDYGGVASEFSAIALAPADLAAVPPVVGDQLMFDYSGPQTALNAICAAGETAQLCVLLSVIPLNAA